MEEFTASLLRSIRKANPGPHPRVWPRVCLRNIPREVEDSLEGTF